MQLRALMGIVKTATNKAFQPTRIKSIVVMPAKNIFTSTFTTATSKVFKRLDSTSTSISSSKELEKKLGKNWEYFGDNLKKILSNNGYQSIDSAEDLKSWIKYTWKISHQYSLFCEDRRKNNLYKLIELIPEDHLRKLIIHAEQLIEILNLIIHDAPSTLLLVKLGNNHISFLINDIDHMLNCWQQNILQLLSSENLRLKINTFEKLQMALAWSSVIAFDKCDYNYQHCEELLRLLGQDHIMSIINNGEQLAALLTKNRVKYGTNGLAHEISSDTFIKFMQGKLSSFKNLKIYADEENKNNSIKPR